MTDAMMLWLPGALVLLAGAIVGMALLWRLKSNRDQESGSDPGAALRDIDERYRVVITMLRDLDEQRGKLDPRAYAAERADLTAQGATLLRSRDTLDEALRQEVRMQTDQPTIAPNLIRRHPQLVGMLWGGGIVACIALFYFAATRVGPSPAQLAPPEEATRNGTATSEDPVFMRAMREVTLRLEAKPDDLEALLDGAHLAIASHDEAVAQGFLDRALRVDPENPDVLLQLAKLLAAEGKTDAAIAHLDLLLRMHPEFADGWFIRGMLGMELGDPVVRTESFKRYLEVAPDGPHGAQARRILAAGSGTP